MSKRLRTALLLLVALLLGFELLYLAGANLFLNSTWGQRTMSRRPEKFQLSWERAWTIIPGRVHAASLLLHGQTPRVRWRGRVEEAAVQLDLRYLFGREVRMDGQGRGVSFEVYREEGPAEGQPPVPPLEVPPGARKPPEVKKKKEGWHIHMPAIVLQEVEEVWIDRFRLRGDGTAEGGFAFVIRGDLTVPTMKASFPAARLETGGQGVAEPLRIEADGRIHPFPPREVKGKAVIPYVSGRAEVHGEVPSLAFLGAYFAQVPWIEHLEGKAELDTVVFLDHGILAAGSELAAQGDELAVDFLDYRAAGAGRVDGVVEERQGTDTAELTVHLDTFEIRRADATMPHVMGEDFELVATAEEVSLLDGAEEVDIALDLPPSTVPDVSFYNAYLPPDTGFVLDGGEATIAGQLRASTGAVEGSGEVRLNSEKISGHFGAVGFTGGLQMVTKLAAGDLEARRFDIAGSELHLDCVALREGGETSTRGWWAHLTLPAGELHASAPLGLEAELDLALRDSGPVVDLFAQRKAWLERLEKILTVEDIRASGRLHLGRSAMRFDGLRLSGDKLEMRANLRLAAGRKDGILYTRFHGIAAGLALSGGERDWKLIRPLQWFEASEAAGDWLPAVAKEEAGEEGAVAGDDGVAELDQPDERR